MVFAGSLLAAMISLAGAPRRCGTPDLSPAAVQKSISGELAAGIAAGREASSSTSVHVAVSEHFAIVWMPSGSRSRDTLPQAMSDTLVGDTVPEAVRLGLTVLERARRLYVDTMGMAVPLAYSSSLHWGVTASGRYLVEMLHVDNENFPGYGLSGGMGYFAVTFPLGDNGESGIAVANDWTSGSLSGWSYVPDTAISGRSTVGHDYRTDWRSGLTATLTHELFHAVQFRYELSNSLHFFYEASAVGMEDRGASWTGDWPQYATYIYENLPRLDDSSSWAYPYGEGLWVQSLTRDCGDDFEKRFWTRRSGHSGESVVTSLKASTTGCVGGFDTLWVRHALRLLGSGRRTAWLTGTPYGTAVESFSLAAAMPSLKHDSLAVEDTISGRKLSLNGLSLTCRAIAAADTPTVVLSGTGSSIHLAGVSAAGAQQDPDFMIFPTGHAAWVALVSPGTDSQDTWLGSGPLPAADTVPAGGALSWRAGDATVAGSVRVAGRFRPWGCRDCWEPKRGDVLFATMDSAHVYRLFDFSRTLVLDSARLSFPAGSSVYGRNDAGNWIALDGTTAADGELAVTLSSLDLSSPKTFLAGRIGSSALRAAVGAPYPNPARQHHAVTFPVAFWKDGMELQIRAADGSLVASFRPTSAETSASWDLRAGDGRYVRPGIYFYRWSRVSGAMHGRLVVAP